MNRSICAVLLVLTLPLAVARADTESWQAQALKVEQEIVPAYAKEFAKLCGDIGLALKVDVDSFAEPPEALAQFTASVVSDPWNRALGPLMTVLRNECGNTDGAAAIAERLQTVVVRHQSGAEAQVALAERTLTITVDVTARKPPAFAAVEGLLKAR